MFKMKKETQQIYKEKDTLLRKGARDTNGESVQRGHTRWNYDKKLNSTNTRGKEVQT